MPQIARGTPKTRFETFRAPSEQAPDTVAEALEKALAEAQDELTRAESTETETRNALHATEREREALAATVSALELALRSESDGSEVISLPGVTGSVSDSLRVTTGYETAIARALGSLADAHLVASKKDALGVVSARTNSQGRMELVIAEGEKVSATDIAGSHLCARGGEGSSGCVGSAGPDVHCGGRRVCRIRLEHSARGNDGRH